MLYREHDDRLGHTGDAEPRRVGRGEVDEYGADRAIHPDEARLHCRRWTASGKVRSYEARMKARGERLFVRGGQMTRAEGAGYVDSNDVVWIP
jgi:hypothetical protein